ncbi:hypothetical protein V8E53_011565 [Lactarius tabidus]
MPRTARPSPFDTISSFQSPDSANIIGNPSDALATLAQLRAKHKAPSSAAHCIYAPALAAISSPVSTCQASVISQVPLRDVALAARRMAAVVTGPVHKAPHFRTPRAVSAEVTTAAGMNPFNMRDGHTTRGAAARGTGHLCWRRIRPAWQSGQPRASGFGAPRRAVPVRCRSPGLGSSAGNGSAKKDEEDFGPVLLNDVVGWLHTLRLNKYTPNFEGMSQKEMKVIDQALEAPGVTALRVSARRKMLKTFRGRS